MIIKGYILPAILSLMTFIGCHKESEPRLKFLATDNPLDSISYFYSRAKAMAGGDIALHEISGVRKSLEAGTEFDINWSLYFVRNGSCIIFKITDGYVSEEMTSAVPVGYELVNENDVRWTTILPPDEVWIQCIADHEIPLLRFSLCIPYYYPFSGEFRYIFHSKKEVSNFGLDAFVYDAGTGEDVTTVN